MIPIVDPQASRRRDWWVKVHATLGPVLSRVSKGQKADESISAPQRARTPRTLRLFPCKPAVLGDRWKGP